MGWWGKGAAGWRSQNGWYRPTPVVGGGGIYTGPGDIASFVQWYGLRAYSAAQAAAGVALVDLVDQAGANTVTIHSTTAGLLDSSAIASWVAAHSVTTIKITKIYDQVGTLHLTQATLVNMPTLTANAINSAYGMTFIAANSTQLNSSTTLPTTALPVTLVGMARAADTAADYGLWTLDPGDYTGIVVDLDADGFSGFNGGATNWDAVPTTTTAMHAYQAVIDGTSSSVVRIDGTETNITTGTQGISNTAVLRLGVENGGKFLNGSMMEFGYVAATVTSTDRSSLNANMHAAYGGW